MTMANEGTTSLSDLLTTVQQGVAALNNLGQLLSQATVNSSALQVTLSSTIFVTPTSTYFIPSSAVFSSGTVTTINTSIGLIGGPISTSGTIAVSLTTLTNSLTGNVVISSNPATYVDGPSVAQGTSGKWWASGSVTVTHAAAVNSYVKLWDGTTVMDSGNQLAPAANGRVLVALSGGITNPAGNIRISVNCPDASTSGVIEFNRTGNSKDSTITVMRIG
jgi:hypothetical protein